MTVEDILPLSPLQQGMLFHALFDTGADDVYTVQFVLGLEGEVDARRLRKAAEGLLARHANLRACFVHEEVDEPVQVVLSEVELPWRETEEDLADVLAADREARFNLDEPPLLRMTLVKLGKNQYRLVLTNHHILLDGWSLPLLVRDLLDLYAARPLPPVRPYRDFLAWLASQDREQSAESWLAALDGVAEPTLFAPAAASRVPVRPEKIRLEVPEELTERLYARARSAGLTVNTVVQGIWGLLLARLTGRDDVVFGATVSGRPADLPGVDSMVGLFINTVPVRVRARPGDSVVDMLNALQVEQSRLMDHQYLGLTEIQRVTGDLFDTLVVFENYPIDTDAVAEGEGGAGLRISQVEIDDATHYPLTLAVAAEKTLTVTFEFRADVVERSQIEAISGYFRCAVEILAEGAEPTVAALDVLSPEERQRLRDFGTGKALDVPETTLAQVLEEQARRTPDAIAVVSGEERLTFAELNGRANSLARVLVERGVGPERIVALVLPPGRDMIVALLAVLKAGGAYLPLDPDWPAERINAMLADAKPVLVLTELPESDRPDENLAPIALPDHPAYVIYTSGSTGTPKAVVVSHRSIVNLLVSHRTDLFDPARARVGRPLRVGHAWPMAFDASWQPMLWMFAGHELHLVPPDVRRDADLLRGFLAEHGIEFIELSPSLLAQVAAEPGWRAELKVLGVGGEAVPHELWRALRADEMLVVYNLYGPTECTVDSVVCELSASESPLIGAPVGNARAYVLDRNLNPCPVGVEGELYIAGAGLARGYLGRAGTTAERFVADPFTGGRMYRTGDIARWTSAVGVGPRQGAGNNTVLIECLGRVDDQVKIRGFRIEPGEIEAVLLRDERVERAVVIPREDTPGVRRLVAYVVARGVEGLRELVAASLPEYMVPAAIVEVDHFPLTRNDKLDVGALPAPEYTGSSVTAPRTEAEARIAELFADVLGVSTVGVEDSFFALGGDSIVSMRLVSKARAAGLGFSPRDVFERRTVAELALVAGQTRRRADPDAGIGEVPLTPMLEWLTRNTPYDRLSQARFLCTPAELELPELYRIVQALLDRHDVLRSTFDGFCTVRPRGAVDAESVVDRIDARALGYDTIAEALPGVLERELTRLAPSNGDMARFVWFDTGPERPGRLLILLHHLVVDGASWGVLVAELADLWRRAELPPVGTSFREWASALREVAHRRAPELDLWREILAGPDPVLGARRLDPKVDNRATMRTTRTSFDAIAPLLTSVPDEHGVTVNEVLLTALAVAAARLRGDGDSSLLIALEGHGREEQIVEGADLSGTVGWFTSVYPVRVDPGDIESSGVHKGLLRVAEQLALPDKGIGHGLLRYLNPDTGPELDRLPEPQIEFNYLGRLTVGERDGEPWTGAPEVGVMGGGVDDEMPAPYCLVINALVRDGAGGPVLEVDWQWPGAIFTETEIQALSREWFAALEMLNKTGDRS